MIHVRPGCHDQCERFVMKKGSVEQLGGKHVREIQAGCSGGRGRDRAQTPAAELYLSDQLPPADVMKCTQRLFPTRPPICMGT